MGQLAHARDVPGGPGSGGRASRPVGQGERPVGKEARPVRALPRPGIHGPGPRRGGHGGPLPIGDILPRTVGGRSVVADPLVDSPERLAPVTTCARAPRTTKAVRATPRPACAGCGRAGSRRPTSGHRPQRARSTAARSTPRQASCCHPSDGRIASADRMPGIRPRRRRRRSVAAAAVPPATPASLASSRSRRRIRGAAARSTSRPGSAGWSCAPASTASRATSDPRRRHAHHPGAAGRHRAARAGHHARPRRRPVRQARRRDDEAHQARPARPAHALGHRRCAARHPGRLRRVRRPRPPARGHPRGLRA